MHLQQPWLVAVALFTSVTLLAQAPSTGSGQAQFKAGVELIQLDVVVLDGKRQPVPGLTASDFSVLDDGKPTPIRAFTPVHLPVRTRATEAVWASEVASDVATNNIATPDGRIVIILMDRTIPAQEATFTAKKIAKAAVESLGPNDLGAVVSTYSGAVQNQTVQNLTADRARLLRAIDAADPATGASAIAESLPTVKAAGGFNDPVLDGRCLCGICVHETIARVADAVRDLPRRRKVLFFIGHNLMWQAPPKPIQTPTLACEIPLKDARQAMLAAVDRANLTVHSIDPAGLINAGEYANAGIGGGWDARPGGLYGPNQRVGRQLQITTETLDAKQNLQQLPDRTGGRTVVGLQDPERAIPAIFHESDAYYVLAIERAPSTRPDATRAIEVKVGRRGLRVVAQRQYGPPPMPMDPLKALLPTAGVPLFLTVMPFASTESLKPVVRVNVDAGAFARSDGTPAALDISVLAVDRTGRGVASARQTSTITAAQKTSGDGPEVSVQSHLELEPGDYGVRVSVADPATGSSASVFADTTVANFPQAPLSLSGVSVELPGASAVPQQTTRRAFARTEQVRAVLQIYQGTGRTDPIVPASMRVQILDAKGTAIRDQALPFPETAFTNRRADCVITLPLAKLPAGEYLLKLDASTSRATAGRALRFEVR